MKPTKRLSDAAIRSIVKSIPEGAVQRRKRLLKDILRSWSDDDLPEYNTFAKLSKGRSRRKQSLGKIAKSIRTLELLLLRASRSGDWDYIAFYLKAQAGERISSDTINMMIERLRKAADTAENNLARDRGQPRNIIAQFVMSDLVAMYEWLYPTEKAARVVDRIEGEETGKFRDFALVLWVKIFGAEGVGLNHAMRTFFARKNQDSQPSALMANMQMRHRSWKVFAE